jgi:hypothetical protein
MNEKPDPDIHPQPPVKRVGRRVRAAGTHLAVSALIAALAAGLVFGLWYPPPYSEIAGGLGLFTLLISVDVSLGPLLTAVVASPGKPRKELVRDIAVIALVQLSAFVYGVHTMAVARPVLVSFEVDRLRVVAANDVDTTTLNQAPAGLRSLSWTGPKLIAAVKPTNPDEQFKSIELGLNGFDLSMLPRNWRDYASQADAVWRKARPVSVLLARHPDAAAEVSRIAAESGQPATALRFLPLMSRRASWTAVLAEPDARIVGYLPLDGFF